MQFYRQRSERRVPLRAKQKDRIERARQMTPEEIEVVPPASIMRVTGPSQPVHLLNRVDLLSGVRGMDPDAVRRCFSARMLDSTVRMIAAEDLIGMKIFAAGPQDMIDVRGILQVWRERLNPGLLRQGPDGFG